MDEIDELKAAGFSDEEINAYLRKQGIDKKKEEEDSSQKEELLAAGFTKEEISEHLSKNDNSLEEGESDILDFNLDFFKFDEVEDDDGVLETGESLAGSWNNLIDHVSLIDDRVLNLAGILTGSEDSEFFQKSEAEIKAVEENSARTLGFTDIGDTYAQEGVVGAAGNIFAATFNALTSLASSVAISYPTFGVGLAVDMVSTSVRDYNVEKAESLDMTLEELMESGGSEVLTPAIIGSIAYSFERFGLKGITKGIRNMSGGLKKQLVQVLNSAGKEGGTEFAQGIMDAINIDLARNGKDFSKVGPEVVRFLKEDALETTLQGAVGGGVSTGAGGGARRRLRAAKVMRSGKANEIIKQSMAMIDQLDQTLSNPEVSEEVKKQTKGVRDRVKKRIEEAVNEPYEAISNFSEEELTKADKIGARIVDLQDQMAEYNELPDEVKEIAQEETRASIEEADEQLNELVKEHEKRLDDIEKAEEALKKAKQSAKEHTGEDKTKVKAKVAEAQAELEKLQQEDPKEDAPIEELTPAEKAIEATELTEEENEDVDAITKLFGPRHAEETTQTPQERYKAAESELSQKVQDQPGFTGTPEGKALLEKMQKADAEAFRARRDSFKASIAEKGASVKNTPQFKALEVEAFNQAAVEHIKKVYPNQAIFNTPEAFSDGIKLAREAGQKIPANLKGFVFEDKIYLHPKKVTKDTAFHELSHIWANTVAKKNIQLFKRGMELLKGTEFMRRIAENPGYQELKKTNNLKFQEEVMALALGEKSAELAKQPKFARWLKEMTNWLKDKLGIASKNNYADLTLNEWLEIGATSILTGDQTATKGEFANTTGIAASIEGATKADVARATKQVKYTEFQSKGVEVPKGWSKDPKYKDLITSRVRENLEKKAKKDERVQLAKENKGQLGPETPPIENATFQQTIKEFAEVVKGKKKSWSQTDKKFLYQTYKDEEGNEVRRITDEQVGIAIASLSHFIDDGLNLASIHQQLGKAFKRKNAPDLNTEQYNSSKYEVGSAIMEYLEDSGKIRTKWDHLYKGYTIDVVDQDYFDGMSESAALFVDNDLYSSVFIGQEVPKDDPTRDYFTRSHPAAKMTRESHPRVYSVVDKADAQKYEVDQEQLANLKEMEKRGLLLDSSQEYTEQQKRSIIRQTKAAFIEMNKVGKNWFTQAHKFLHNGRLMSAAQGLTHQGSKFILSTFSFQEKKPMGKKGLQFTKILATDTYGFSGADSFDSREAFFEKNKDKWIEIAKNPFGTQENIDYIMGADTPPLFLRYITELKNAYEHADGPENFPSGLPNHMDATTSGIQFLAALSGDQEAAKIANISDTEQRFDSYMNIVRRVWDNKRTTFTKEEQEIVANYESKINSRLEENAAKREEILKHRPEGNDFNSPEWTSYKALWDKYKEETKQQKSEVTNQEKDLASQMFWAKPGIQKKMRKIFKKPVMTKYYSAQIAGISDGIYSEFKDHKDFAGINKTYTYWMAREIYNKADEVFKGPGNIMAGLQEIAKVLHEKNGYVRYTQDNGFIVANDPKVTKNKEVTYTSKNLGKLAISVAYNTDERSLNAQKRQIAPLVVHSFDAQLVHYLHENAKYPIQTIHDSFATTPEFTEQLYKDVRKGFAHLAQPQNLKNILEEMLGDKALAEEFFAGMLVGDFNAKGQIEKNPHGFSAGVTNPNIGQETSQDVAVAETFEGDLTAETVLAKADLVQEESKKCK